MQSQHSVSTLRPGRKSVHLLCHLVCPPLDKSIEGFHSTRPHEVFMKSRVAREELPQLPDIV